MKLSPSDQRLLLACFMPCRGCKLECRYYHRRIVDKGKCALCNHSIAQHIPDDKKQQETLLSRLFQTMEHRLSYPAYLNDADLCMCTIQMLCDMLLGNVVHTIKSPEASVARWVFVEECLDQELAHLFKDALASNAQCSGVSTPFPDISRRLRRELGCYDSLLYQRAGEVHAELIAWFMLDKQYGLRAIEFAAHYGLFDAMTQILNGNTQVHITTLYFTFYGDHVKVFELLLRRCPGMRKHIVPGVLEQVICADAVNIASVILDRYVSSCSVTIGMFERACILGSHRTIKLLLERVPRIRRDWSLSNALHGAVTWGHTEIVRLLLDYVPRDCYKSCMLTACAVLKTPDIVSLFLARGTVPSIMDLVYCRSVATAKLLLAAGANVNQVVDSGLTPLMFMAQNDDDKIAHLLIDSKTNVNTPNRYGHTPLHWAACNGSMDVMRLLVFASADINAQSCDGTPLAHAYMSRQYLAARILTYAGAQL